jgi:hypothetical protein
LRRQFERGALTYEEYFDRLNALQGTARPAADEPQAGAEPARDAGGTPSRHPASEPPKLIGALAVLGLRPRPEKREPTAPKSPAGFKATEKAHAAAPEPALTQTTTPTAEPTRPKGPPIFTTQASPARFMAMKCLRCGAGLRIYDRTTELECSDCRTEMVVERKDCTIALRLAAELPGGPNAGTAAAASARTDEALKKLRTEEAMVTNVKRSAGILGGICGVVFAYLGIADMAARNIAMGATIFVFGSALLCTVVCITRKTSRVRAELNARILAMNAGEESVGKLGGG